jgi:hypothetical protein
LPKLHKDIGGDNMTSLADSPSLRPWQLWRMNFYRYSYPSGPDAKYDNFELNAWSSTHDPSFHVPERFGVVVLDMPTR